MKLGFLYIIASRSTVNKTWK